MPDPENSQPGSDTGATNYDYLFKEPQPLVVDEAMRSEWPVLDERQRKLFAPFSKPEEEVEQLVNYDYLFSSQDQPELSVGRAAVIKSKDSIRTTTEESEREAAIELISPAIDPVIIAIISQHVPETATSVERVKAIYNDAAVREELARYILGKINKVIHKMPDRVVRNTQKKPDWIGYEGYITSREYATLLAISMLDGSYKREPSMQDFGIEYDKNGQVILGQHRAAARLLLER